MVAKFLSFDCALITLGYCYIEIDFDKLNEAKRMMGLAIKRIDDFINNNLTSFQQTKELVNIIIDLVDILDTFQQWIKFHGDVLNVLDGKKIKEVTKQKRAQLLKHALEKIIIKHNIIMDENLTVLIEIQPMTTNFTTSTIADQLILFFADCNVELISALLKNNVSYTPELDYSMYLKSKKSKNTNTNTNNSSPKTNEQLARLQKVTGKNYKSNKDHAKDNFLYAVGVYNFDISNMKPAMLGHCADAYQQLIAYIRKTYVIC